MKKKISDIAKRYGTIGLLGLATIFSCEREYYYPSENSDVKLYKNVNVIKDPSVISHYDGTSISLSSSTNYEYGDIIVSGPSEKIPRGLLVEVDERSRDGKKYKIKPGHLEDVIKKGKINFNKELKITDLDQKYYQKISKQNGYDFYHKFSKVIFDEDGDTTTIHDQVKANCEIGFNAELGLDIEFDNGIKNLDIDGIIDSYASVETIGNIEKEFVKRIPIAKYYFSPIPVCATPPIAITPIINVYFENLNSGKSSFEASVDFENTFGTKISYNGNSWEEPNLIEDHKFEFKDGYANYDFNSAAVLNEEAIFLINGIYGPFLSAREYLKINSSNSEWELYGGLRFSVGVKADGLSKILPEYDATIYCNEFLIHESKVENDLEAILVSTPQIGKAPLYVKFDATESTPKEKITSYQFIIGDKCFEDDDGIFEYVYLKPGTHWASVTISDGYNSSKSELATIVEEPNSPAWKDDFERYREGLFPSSWIPDANAIKYGKIKSDGENKYLEMKGSLGGCWGGLAFRDKKATFPYEIKLRIKNGTEDLSGCHPDRAYVGLRNGNSWTMPGFMLFYFKEDGSLIDANNNKIVDTDLNNWNEYNVVVNTNSIDYFINGEFVKRIDNLTVPNYPNLDLSIQEGTAFFDDILVRQL